MKSMKVIFCIAFQKNHFQQVGSLAEVKYADLILKVRGDHNGLIVANDSRLAFLLQEKSASNQ